mgnify:CR=1 FL=1
MSTDNEAMIRHILDWISGIGYIKPEDIPNIDLYMDQVTTFMEEQLSSTKRYEDDKILTKTMINNYAKNNLLPPPNKKKYSKICEGKKLATLFFEPSTRTRLSFEAAMLELGGSVLGFSEASSTSASKGETVGDTTKVISCYADIIAMRHYIEGAPKVAASKASIPVINAGDGGHSHPTQTMTDLLTVYREKGRLDNLTIGLCGDLKFGRTVHSLVKAMCRYSNIRFVLIAPKELAMPDYIKTDYLDKNGMEYIETDKMEDVMPQLDVLYMTRVQRERFFSEDEYLKHKDAFILDLEKLKNAKSDLTIMHPLPRVNEIATEVDDDPRAKYFEQVLNGKYMRMALIITLLKWAGGLD